MGPLTLIGDKRYLRGLYFPGRAPRLDEADHDPEAFTTAVKQLEQYFTGERQTFELPLKLEGTAFQQRVWHALGHLPYGQTTTYGDLARQLDGDTGTVAPQARVVAWAISRTPAPIIVPCHRVVAADGSLSGYLGGLQRKHALLEFEAAGGLPCVLLAQWNERQLALL